MWNQSFGKKQDISYTYFIVMTSNLNCFSWLRAQVKGRIEKNLTATFTFDIDAVKRPIALPGFHKFLIIKKTRIMVQS